MALWCLIAGPLLISTDLQTISNESLAVLKSPELIAVHQDPAGVQGVRVSPAAPDGVEVWAKPLASGAVAAVFLNRSPEPQASVCRYDAPVHTPPYHLIGVFS